MSIPYNIPNAGEGYDRPYANVTTACFLSGANVVRHILRERLNWLFSPPQGFDGGTNEIRTLSTQDYHVHNLGRYSRDRRTHSLCSYLDSAGS